MIGWSPVEVPFSIGIRLELTETDGEVMRAPCGMEALVGPGISHNLQSTILESSRRVFF